MKKIGQRLPLILIFNSYLLGQLLYILLPYKPNYNKLCKAASDHCYGTSYLRALWPSLCIVVILLIGFILFRSSLKTAYNLKPIVNWSIFLNIISLLLLIIPTLFRLDMTLSEEYVKFDSFLGNIILAFEVIVPLTITIFWGRHLSNKIKAKDS